MNDLTNQIVKHIFDNLGLTDNRQVSLLQFLTDKTIQFSSDGKDEEISSSQIWACQTVINNVRFRMMSTSFPDIEETETIFISKLDNCPTYGCSLITGSNPSFLEGHIGCKMNEESWVPTTIFIQATFLAGMEQLKDISGSFAKCSDNTDLVDDLKSFIAFKENQ